MTDKALIVPDAARVTTVTPWAQIAGLGSTTHTRYDAAAGSRRGNGHRPRRPVDFQLAVRVAGCTYTR